MEFRHVPSREERRQAGPGDGHHCLFTNRVSGLALNAGGYLDRCRVDLMTYTADVRQQWRIIAP